jgi:hypothetical protein
MHTGHTESPAHSTFAEATPSKIANVCVRRAHYGSTLLQSPARPGHSAGMRSIFHTASQHNPPASLYPQLPNVSRKASQAHGATSPEFTAYVPSLHQPAPLLPGTHSQPANLATSPKWSQQDQSVSSESWSDDTGYLVAGSRCHPSELTVPPAERITHWLSEVCEPETYDPLSLQQNSPERLGVYENECDPTQTTWSNRVLPSCESTIWEPRTLISPERLWEGGHVSVQDIFSTSSANQKFSGLMHVQNFDSSQDDGIQLSPLSPKVCVERGPSRHHSKRKPGGLFHHPPNMRQSLLAQIVRLNDDLNQEGSDAGIHDSPIKPLLQARRRRLQLAENAARNITDGDNGPYAE